MPDIVITEFMDQAAVDSLACEFDVLYDPDLVGRAADLLNAVEDARALIVRNRTQVHGDLLQAASRLKVVGRLGVGLDNIDLPACQQRGVVVRPASGANDAAVAEYVVTTAMLLLRNAYAATHDVLAGNWPRQRCMGLEIAGKTLGLVGFGGIAQETARRASALGMVVLAYDPYIKAQEFSRAVPSEFDQLIATADVVSLHIPLTETTRGLINQSVITAMKPGAILINTARGGIVDEIALAEALRSGHLAGAALDVFAHEPVTEASARQFADLDNVVLTPHIAGVTQESNVRVSAVTAANVREVLVT